MLFSTGRRRSNNEDDGVSGSVLAAAALSPNCAPACGSPEILGTTTIIFGLGRYHGRWQAGKNKRSTGTFQVGGWGGGGKSLADARVHLEEGLTVAAVAESGGLATSN